MLFIRLATVLPVRDFAFLSFFLRNDRSVVVQAQWRTEMKEEFRLFKFKKLPSRLYLDVAND